MKKFYASATYSIQTLKTLAADPGHFSLKKASYAWNLKTETRIDIIKAIAAQYSDCRYLEIGCRSDTCFSQIDAAVKVGVDPASGGTHRMTSDAFFETHADRFDLVFVDGLHTYGQSRTDAINALSRLPVGGCVVFHDMIPLDWRSAHPEQISRRWNGDVWKTGVELSLAKGITFRIALADHGVGIACKTSEEVYVPDLQDSLSHAHYNDFLAWLKVLPLAPYGETLDGIRREGTAFLARPLANYRRIAS
jgi:hypothetical protein